MRTRLLLAAAALVGGPAALAQTPVPTDWHLLDTADGVVGVSAARAYEMLAGRTASPVVVAVIDSGVDTAHPDLAPALWTNPEETAGNGVDDDGNGYVDDVHGWGFLGGPDGRNVEHESLELARLVAAGRSQYAADSTSDPAGYARYRALEADLAEQRAEYAAQAAQMSPIFSQVRAADSLLAARFPGVYDRTNGATLDGGSDPDVQRAQQMVGFLAANGATVEDLIAFEDQLASQLNYGLNPDYSARGIVGDDPLDTSDRAYGNADVAGPDPSHGTGVAGLIAAVRGNGIGIDGIAPNTATEQPVRIMAVRAVPDGDERDKDVANAIRYAVDNGARIINMSFGKAFSPQKSAVDEAVRYATERGVLLVHASGNSGEDLEPTAGNDNFPTAFYDDGQRSTTWLEIGASASDAAALAAPFSNYGGTRVDLFAPGAQVTSLAPGGGVQTADGTSFASPVTAGVAALLMAYFPDLTAADVRQILVDSAVRYADAEVGRPGDGETVRFGTLSVTGGVVNAAEAVRLAMERTSN
ncbi:MAG TPA: S8 family serine peptidase [Rubricoccaceae bacterium]|jgi:subtilisin family serine protease